MELKSKKIKQKNEQNRIVKEGSRWKRRKQDLKGKTYMEKTTKCNRKRINQMEKRRK